MRVEIDIAQDEPAWAADCASLIARAIAAADGLVNPAVNQPAELSILLTNDRQQQALNKTWRDIDRSTNVLSFPQIDPFESPVGQLGDISLAFETVKAEAEEQAKPINDHLTHLVVHGFLHILGYDHVKTDDAEIMEQLEIDIMAQLGLSDPYTDLGTSL